MISGDRDKKKLEIAMQNRGCKWTLESCINNDLSSCTTRDSTASIGSDSKNGMIQSQMEKVNQTTFG
jgi:hypothetical protein